MRFTLEQLESLVPNLLLSGYVNTPIEGYPIIHNVMMELRDESDHRKHPRYLALIESILRNPHCKPDVFDKHGKSSLMYAAQSNNLYLVRLLLQYGANPNLVCRQLKKTALEYACFINPDAHKTIRELRDITQRTPRLKENCEELFERAKEEDDVSWINILLNLSLVTWQRQINIKERMEPKNNLPRAFWIRTISNPAQEQTILAIRERMSDEALARQRHTTNTTSAPNYTKYSPSTFVRQGIPGRLFSGGDHAGVMIGLSNQPIPYWYDGHMEELTREMWYTEGSRLDNGNTGQHYEITSDKIAAELERRYLKEAKEYYDNAARDKEQYDRHGVLLDKQLSEIGYTWNEGLLRYKCKHIFGIYVNPNNKKHVEEALNLRRILNVNVPLYSYDQETGIVKRMASATLIRKWNLHTPAAVNAGTQPLLLSGRLNNRTASVAASAAQATEHDMKRRARITS